MECYGSKNKAHQTKNGNDVSEENLRMWHVNLEKKSPGYIPGHKKGGGGWGRKKEKEGER